jgi:hypothetical protein
LFGGLGDLPHEFALLTGIGKRNQKPIALGSLGGYLGRHPVFP